MAELNLEIERLNYAGKVKFWLWREGHTHDVFYTQGENGELFEQRIESNNPMQGDLKPLLVLPRHLADQFIRLIAEHANKQGVNTENESKLMGKLAAKEEHLADFKKLLFHTLNVKD